MPNFKYVAKDQSGRAITGFIEANDRSGVIDILRKKDIIIISVEEAGGRSRISALFEPRKKRVKLEEIAIFCRQLATMIGSGIPLVAALDILSEQSENRTFGETIKLMRNDVETGSSLSEAIAKHKKIFSPLFVNMVKAGESSGMLDEILDRLATYLEKSNSLQKKIQSALVYPAIVSLMAFGITMLLLLKVIPIFKNIFLDFGAELPGPTKFLIFLSDIMQKYFPLVIIFAAAAGFALSRYLATEKGGLKADSVLLKMPVFGILFRKIAISKFTRTLSTLIKSGVPILSALEIVGKTAGNRVIERAVENVRTNVREGEGISDPLAKSKVFPPMVTRMVAVGEQSGELEKMLTKIADFYDEQVDAAVAALTSMIEPLIIAFLGIVIGTIVICMFLPLFKLTAIVGT